MNDHLKQFEEYTPAQLDLMARDEEIIAQAQAIEDRLKTEKDPAEIERLTATYQIYREQLDELERIIDSELEKSRLFEEKMKARDEESTERRRLIAEKREAEVLAEK